MITGSENIQTIADSYPEVITEFEKHGLGSYFKPENLKKIGRFMILNTLLKSSNIDVDQFLKSLNEKITSDRSNGELSFEQLHFMAMLPCGLRNPFKDFLEKHITGNSDEYAGLNYLAEGNVNHELSYYPLLDSIESVDELPDIILASDVNNFFHRPFMEKFVSKGLFETFKPYQPHSYLEDVGFSDPLNNFTMLTANMLVMVVDTRRLGEEKIPEKWEDILNPAFEDEIIMRGEDNFFCNAVMLPFYKDHGFDAIRTLARNIRTGKHPAEMVKLAEAGGEKAATIYIMPYFFAQRIKSKHVKIVWPSDGAIASPVFMLVKKDAMEEHLRLLNFVLSKETNEMLVGRHFPSIHPDVENILPQPAKWLGWDFLTQHDVGKLKDDIRDVFMNVWNVKSSQLV